MSGQIGAVGSQANLVLVPVDYMEVGLGELIFEHRSMSKFMVAEAIARNLAHAVGHRLIQEAMRAMSENNRDLSNRPNRRLTRPRIRRASSTATRPARTSAREPMSSLIVDCDLLLGLGDCRS